jgi:hypothetical protein
VLLADSGSWEIECLPFDIGYIPLEALTVDKYINLIKI